MSRIEVLKTYKIYIGGKFPRTESGRYYQPMNDKNALGNICLSSRKDLRNAVVAARGALAGWSNRTAYNKSQILYRIAEMLEGRRAQFVSELEQQGSSKAEASKEVDASIDRLIYFAGWCDKYTQVFGAINPVATSHFNFSSYEPTGVVGIITPEKSSLLGLVSVVAPVIAGGNTCVVLASESKPLCAITFAEVLATSDVSGGVVNILTGKSNELLPHFGSHMDINAVTYCREDKTEIKALQLDAVDNLKRIKVLSEDVDHEKAWETPYLILDHSEVKTTWHPVENISAAGSGY
ncbi:aldehyde dehydrogenase family protein [Parvicella tangerina]|uniref:NAD/NADP-dependent betaine aldehyde dehydrogenase n=1 Tax=Parvicella tangerina TaxID=2829795 RepID=A0A916JLZ0_9FLAO|nr:aldehyde dehydrogenase family protein [Parvicella tangerina]CAG5078588.1 NAD/NADP-dependent betaine aldehyde dehydrogenase [Parvicella tangerina]